MSEPDFSTMTNEQLGQHLETTLMDVGSGNSVSGISLSAELDRVPALSGLSPAMQDRINAKLVHVPFERRAEHERQAILEELQANSTQMKPLSGLDGSANALQREALQIALDARQYQTDIQRLQERLDAVSGFDPQTGQPIPALTGQARVSVENELNNKRYGLAQVTGIEGQARMEKAKAQAVADIRAAQEQLDEFAEGKRRAAERLKDERINKTADAYVKRGRVAL